MVFLTRRNVHSRGAGFILARFLEREKYEDSRSVVRTSVALEGASSLLEQHEEWIAGRPYCNEQSMTQLRKQDSRTEEPETRV